MFFYSSRTLVAIQRGIEGVNRYFLARNVVDNYHIFIYTKWTLTILNCLFFSLTNIQGVKFLSKQYKQTERRHKNLRRFII